MSSDSPLLTEQDRKWLATADPKSPGMALVIRLLDAMDAMEREFDLAIRAAHAASKTARSWRDEATSVTVRDLTHRSGCGIFSGSVSCNCGAVVEAVKAAQRA